jgi:exosortase C (VPDSG-CTERM-specific)
MPEAEKAVASSLFGLRPAATGWQGVKRAQRLHVAGLGAYASLLTLLFAQPLARLLGLALQNDLHSYIPLVPVVSGYLLYTRPRTAVRFRSSVGAAILLAAAAVGAMAAANQLAGSLSVNDDLGLRVLGYVCFLMAGGFLFLGAPWMASAAFPVAFLIVMVPLPDVAVDWLERALVAASADTAALFFSWTGTPLLREGTTLTLPGIVLEVARECSGIRSTVVLFITSVLAAHLFLAGTWRRAVVIAFVAPLAIVRNGFRILVIGWLCVHVGPHMSESFIHRHGGPIFFVLSLVPLLVLLVWLRRHDEGVRAPGSHSASPKVG